MGARVKFGDIIEIDTERGYAYAQYTHKDPMMGALIRVFKGFYPNGLKDFTNLIEQPTQFSTFFPLQRAVNIESVKIVGKKIPIRNDLKAFPVFRVGGLIDPERKKTRSWSLWDGNEEIRIDQLTSHQKKLPIKATWNDTMLISRIENEWSPEKDITT